MSNREKRACIVVLGDIGRSPRMQYHAQSLMEENYFVDIIGYIENKPIAAICNSPQVKIHEVYAFPEINLPAAIKYLLKFLWQAITLFSILISIKRPQVVVVQNPPGVPTLLLCYWYCLLTKTKFLIDWHNYTHTILALSSRPNGYFVRLAKWLESTCGRKAHANFCVTKAMKDDLQRNWNISATVLYDRPHLQFKPITLEKKHELFMKLSKDYSQFLPKDCGDFKESGVLESTAFTQKMQGGNVAYKSNRPGILISSTSWTQDEDFQVLLDALKAYDDFAKNLKNYPSLLCIITGKGPEKEFFLKAIKLTNWSKVLIITPWLEAEDYPLLLACADLGVCLHWSSSGLDLPMKVVDMFGCGLPVCAIKFKCLSELVVHGNNGFIFNDANELSDQIQSWFENFPESTHLLYTKEAFQKNLRQFQTLRWKENWRLTALPIFESLL